MPHNYSQTEYRDQDHCIRILISASSGDVESRLFITPSQIVYSIIKFRFPVTAQWGSPQGARRFSQKQGSLLANIDHSYFLENRVASSPLVAVLYQLKGLEIVNISNSSDVSGQPSSPPMAPTPSAKPSTGLEPSFLPRSPPSNPSASSSLPPSPTAGGAAKVPRYGFTTSYRTQGQSARLSGASSLDHCARLASKLETGAIRPRQRRDYRIEWCI